MYPKPVGIYRQLHHSIINYTISRKLIKHFLLFVGVTPNIKLRLTTAAPVENRSSFLKHLGVLLPRSAK
jgi:hypothetical protein